MPHMKVAVSVAYSMPNARSSFLRRLLPPSEQNQAAIALKTTPYRMCQVEQRMPHKEQQRMVEGTGVGAW